MSKLLKLIKKKILWVIKKDEKIIKIMKIIYDKVLKNIVYINITKQ